MNLSYKISKTGTQSCKKNSSVDFYTMLELINRISHVTILAYLIGQFQCSVKLLAKISIGLGPGLGLAFSIFPSYRRLLYNRSSLIKLFKISSKPKPLPYFTLRQTFTRLCCSLRRSLNLMPIIEQKCFIYFLFHLLCRSRNGVTEFLMCVLYTLLHIDILTGTLTSIRFFPLGWDLTLSISQPH